MKKPKDGLIPVEEFCQIKGCRRYSLLKCMKCDKWICASHFANHKHRVLDMMDGLNQMIAFFVVMWLLAIVVLLGLVRLAGFHPISAIGAALGL